MTESAMTRFLVESQKVVAEQVALARKQLSDEAERLHGCRRGF
jgi:hypothetical protein